MNQESLNNVTRSGKSGTVRESNQASGVRKAYYVYRSILTSDGL